MPSRTTFAIDFLGILEEAASDMSIKPAWFFGTLCAFWETHGVLYGDLSGIQSQIINKVNGLPSKKGVTTKLLKQALTRQGSSSKYPRVESGAKVPLDTIHTCVQMMDWQSSFELAVITEKRSKDFMKNLTSPEICKHCGKDLMHVISWRDMGEACAVKNARFEQEFRKRAPQIVKRIMDDVVRIVPVGRSPQRLWEEFFQGYARTSSEVTVVDLYLGENRQQDVLVQFLTLLDKDLGRETNRETTVTLFTRCDGVRKEACQEYIRGLFSGLRNIGSLKVYLFDAADHTLDPMYRFPRDRWLGFDEERFTMHGIDVLTSARPGERVVRHISPSGEQSSSAMEFLVDEARLREGKLGIPWDPPSSARDGPVGEPRLWLRSKQ